MRRVCFLWWMVIINLRKVNLKERFLALNNAPELSTVVMNWGAHNGVNAPLDNLLAISMLHQGRSVEAEAVIRRSIKNDKIARAASLVTLSEIMLARGRFEDAHRLALGALYFHRDNCGAVDAFVKARARQFDVRALIALGRWEAAATQYARLETDLSSDQTTWKNIFEISADRGFALLKTGQAGKAVKIMNRLVTKQTGAETYEKMEAQALLALARLEVGQNRGLAKLDTILRRLVEKWGEGTNQSGDRFPRVRLLIESYFQRLYKKRCVITGPGGQPPFSSPMR